MQQTTQFAQNTMASQSVEVPKYKIVFEKEQTLRNCLEAFALKKGYTGNLDKLAKNILFVVDGNLLSSMKQGVAMLLDVVVKPTQDVRLIPAIKAG